MAFIGPACIEARMNNGVEAQRLGLGNGLDAGVGGGGAGMSICRQIMQTHQQKSLGRLNRGE